MKPLACDRHYDPPVQQPRESKSIWTPPPGAPRVIEVDNKGRPCAPGKGCSWIIAPRDLPKHGGGCNGGRNGE